MRMYLLFFTQHAPEDQEGFCNTLAREYIRTEIMAEGQPLQQEHILGYLACGLDEVVTEAELEKAALEIIRVTGIKEVEVRDMSHTSRVFSTRPKSRLSA